MCRHKTFSTDAVVKQSRGPKEQSESFNIVSSSLDRPVDAQHYVLYKKYESYGAVSVLRLARDHIGISG